MLIQSQVKAIDNPTSLTDKLRTGLKIGESTIENRMSFTTVNGYSSQPR